MTTSAELADGWQLACTAPDQCQGPEDLDGLDWTAARVPGTAAGALRDAGAWQLGDSRDFDGADWWFRTTFEAGPAARGEEVWLSLDGIATVSEVFLNGDHLLESDSMFASHRVDVSQRLRAGGGGPANELVIGCRALGPRLRVRRRPRARWRTRLVADGNLRFYRTMLLGRAPGFAPGPACVGPWKPVRLTRRHGVSVDSVRLRTVVDGSSGRLSVRGVVRVLGSGEAPGDAWVELVGPSGTHRESLAVAAGAGGFEVVGELVVPGVERWWPHTHGTPALYEVRLGVAAGGQETVELVGRVGFRDLRTIGGLERDGIQLRVNDVPVFARGAVWTPLDLA